MSRRESVSDAPARRDVSGNGVLPPAVVATVTETRPVEPAGPLIPSARGENRHVSRLRGSPLHPQPESLRRKSPGRADRATRPPPVPTIDSGWIGIPLLLTHQSGAFHPRRTAIDERRPQDPHLPRHETRSGSGRPRTSSRRSQQSSQSTNPWRRAAPSRQSRLDSRPVLRSRNLPASAFMDYPS